MVYSLEKELENAKTQFQTAIFDAVSNCAFRCSFKLPISLHVQTAIGKNLLVGSKITLLDDFTQRNCSYFYVNNEKKTMGFPALAKLQTQNWKQ